MNGMTLLMVNGPQEMFITKFGIIAIASIVALVLFWRHIFILTLFILAMLFILEVNYGGFQGYMMSWVK
jgi:hypothetical protein